MGGGSCGRKWFGHSNNIIIVGFFFIFPKKK
jgi:hypothetical protein